MDPMVASLSRGGRRIRAELRWLRLDEHVRLEEHLDADEGRGGHRHREADLLGDGLDARHEGLDRVRGPSGDVEGEADDVGEGRAGAGQADGCVPQRLRDLGGEVAGGDGLVAALTDLPGDVDVGGAGRHGDVVVGGLLQHALRADESDAHGLSFGRLVSH
jgi:hypothetical protein